ncbi:hypothetical protein NPIL_305221 [Nephila pilipes]|uniref:Uncharacterized protein n=1 Tax=Nephila pilipes TaxID=299642 RepID=A0A8X6TD56_NEPPI|nr:hypothetical protein NPIL_305221 [Nephila pilipes]
MGSLCVSSFTSPSLGYLFVLEWVDSPAAAPKGISGSTQNDKNEVRVNLSNLSRNSQWDIDMVVLSKNTEFTPAATLDISNLKIPIEI